ncbi:MAG: bifunctional diguanylate cyclase/phosphodiesterase [Hyphomonadaceae bacterium]
MMTDRRRQQGPRTTLRKLFAAWMRLPVVYRLSAVALLCQFLALSAIFTMSPGWTKVLALACVMLGSLAGALVLGTHRRTLHRTRKLQSQQSVAERAARCDSLTGLPNRLAFRQHLEAAVSVRPAQPVVVMFADLDRFKEVNDGLGHDAGDALLVEIARRFKAAMGADDLLARLGGDEFAAVLIGEDAGRRVEEIAEAARLAVEAPVTIKDTVVSVGVSVGVAGGDYEEVTSEELLRRADIAMYSAKADRTCAFRRFTADMDEAVILKRAMRSDLETAISCDQLRLDLQPVFCARSGRVVSAEALMRWRHPGRGELSPSKFIALAEESGQIIELGDWALERALESIRELDGVPVAVNVSPHQFRDSSFARSVSDRLLKARVPAKLLRIEITEGVLITHTDAARRTIRQLRDIGVQVVLDDFGTGYSSLSYLQSFDFDAVKIDRSFIRDLGGKHQSTQLTRAIIDMGHGLGMEVVAEGVENARQASLLQLLGCDQLQGFYLGVPAALDELRENALKVNEKLAASPGSPGIVSLSASKRLSA